MSLARALIVEDERLAANAIHRLLLNDPDIEVIGIASDGRTAVNEIRAHRPDIVFLDIEIPELDGFGVIEEVGVENMPLVVFVTAYDRYTLRAFEVYALDTKVDVSPSTATPAINAALETRAAVMKAMQGHVLAKAVYVGLFKRPQ